MFQEERCNLGGNFLEVVPAFFSGKVLVTHQEFTSRYTCVSEREDVNALGIKRRNATLKLLS